MQTVRSRDGVEIDYWTSGSGPNLVLVHGSSADHTRWGPVMAAFEQYFTVSAMDRRGRGGSGDALAYSLEAEFEDVAAVCDALDGPVYLIGHSFGALCCLEAALRTGNLAGLVLYEPPTQAEGYDPSDVVRRMNDLLEQDDREGVLTILFREVVGTSEGGLQALKADPSWRARLAGAHTIPREFADAEYVLDPSRFSGMTTPTLLLLVSESPPFLKSSTGAVAAALPNSQVVALEGQGHLAITTASQLFSSEVIGFLRRSLHSRDAARVGVIGSRDAA